LNYYIIFIYIFIYFSKIFFSDSFLNFFKILYHLTYSFLTYWSPHFFVIYYSPFLENGMSTFFYFKRIPKDLTPKNTLDKMVEIWLLFLTISWQCNGKSLKFTKSDFSKHSRPSSISLDLSTLIRDKQ
jgi:hypothetical protein